MFRNGVISSDEAKELKHTRDKVFWETKLPFVKQHKGFRPCCIHGILAPTTAGKTTLCRTIVDDIHFFHPENKIGVWLSEESKESYLTDLMGDKDSMDNKSLIIFSEVDSFELVKTPKKANDLLVYFANENDLDFLIIDNTTTGALFGHDWTEHKKACSTLKSIALELKIPVVYFCHSSPNKMLGSNRIIENEDIRGFKDLLNLSEYFYVLQTFVHGNSKISTIRITKHRGHDINEIFFRLEYGVRKFVNSYPINFDSFKEVIKNANKL